MKSLFILIGAAFALSSFATHAEERRGKAVFETSTNLGMKLTDKALINIEVKTMKLDSTGDYNLPPESIVHFQDQVGVYRRRDGWFRLIKIQILKNSDREVSVRSTELRAGDELVIHGADLLRVSEMDAFGAGE